MLRELLHSKIHRATVTAALPDYIGSITIDVALLEACGMRVNDKVLVTNCRSGERFETYIFKGARGSGAIEVNGAAARLVEPGDLVIIMHFALLTDEEHAGHRPTVLIMGEKNAVREVMLYER